MLLNDRSGSEWINLSNELDMIGERKQVSKVSRGEGGGRGRAEWHKCLLGKHEIMSLIPGTKFNKNVSQVSSLCNRKCHSVKQKQVQKIKEGWERARFPFWTLSLR